MATAVVALYFPAFDRWMVGDDVRNQLWAIFHRFQIFTNKGLFFRPIENLVNATNTWLLGPDLNWLNVGVGLAGLILSTFLVWRIARLLLPSEPVYPVLAAGYFIFNSLAVAASIQIDTICTQYATVFTLAALLWFLTGQARSLAIHCCIAFALMFLALLSKESSFGMMAAIPIFLPLFKGRSAALEGLSTRQIVLRTSLIAASVLVAYLMARAGADTTAWGGGGSRNAQLVIDPLLWVKHAVVMIVPLFYVGSTLDIFPWLNPSRLIFSLILTSPLVVLSAIGARSLVKSPSSAETRITIKISVALVLCIGASLVPSIMTNHLSETWSTAPLPFASLLMWQWVLRGWRGLCSAHPTKTLTAAAAAYLVVAGMWMAFGLREKVALSVVVASNSRHLFDQAQRHIERSRQRDFQFCVSDEVNANGRSIAERVSALSVGEGPTKRLYNLQGNSLRYNIFYDIPSDVLRHVGFYLTYLHRDRVISTGESSGCIRLSLLTPSDA